MRRERRGRAAPSGARQPFRSIRQGRRSDESGGSAAEQPRLKFKRYQRPRRSYPSLDNRERMLERGRGRKRGRGVTMMQTDRTKIGLGGARGSLRRGLRSGGRMKVRGAEQLHDDQQRQREPANPAHPDSVLAARCHQHISAARFTWTLATTARLRQPG